MRGAQVVEIRREEYERTKRSILKKIRRRLVILGVIIGLLSVVAFILGGVIRGYFSHILKFHRETGHVALANLYFIYAAASLVFSFHGFYIDGKWRKLQQDGNRLILHVRTFFILGVGSWATALWLGIATVSAFGLVEVQYIASSSPNLIYLTTLAMVTVHLVVSPWLLRTIHRKGSQADEFFGAEFLSDIRRDRKQNDDSDSDDSDTDGAVDSHAAAVRPVNTSPREPNRTASQRKLRRDDNVKAEQKDSVLQVYFYGSQYGTDTVFLCEFVLLFARRFFQATFKCKEREATSDFVTRFNLQELLLVEGE
ncbi:hypothetical protein KRP22_000798 [Phytophthora ramorum]|uniref:uncharacterized protein n=1 Tax=Phytophthora ramorum TaxID=164328 RepID=UPI0030A78173|nr:hypothetical protein KRP23_7545 [Phytophthora ramorum]KAH7508956.1 hypothetical protein KRP22_465 [Phytophthora ramorum]